MKNYLLIFTAAFIFVNADAQNNETLLPDSSSIISPIHKKSFNNDGECPVRKQGGNTRMINGYQVFDGSMDGDRQVDPQIAVGGGYILEASNRGLIIYDKKGNFINGVSQKCFNNGIDPKLAFDIHDKVFLFDMWWYYDKAKEKPVNISVSETINPNGAWNIYPVSRKEEVDGGAIGYSKKWIAYSYPGGSENAFVLKMSDAKAGKPATVYFFKGNIGEPVMTQDDVDDLYFFSINDSEFIVRKISEGTDGKPYCTTVSKGLHHFQYIDYPPESPQKGTAQKISSGDRNPKNLILQNGCIWFSQAVNCNGRSAVQWSQLSLSKNKFLQTGLIKSDTTNYIQTTIGVNKNNDVLIGFQEANEHSFVSSRFTYRLHKDRKGTTRKIIRIAEGKAAGDGDAWGDYSGTCIDGDNLTNLWTIQSWANAKGKASSVIIKVPFKK